MSNSSTTLANFARAFGLGREQVAAIRNNPIVADILQKGEEEAVAAQRARHDELLSTPAKFAKRLAAAGAAVAATTKAEHELREALRVASEARRTAEGVAHGLEMLAARTHNGLHDELVKNAPALVIAAERAAFAFSWTAYEPAAPLQVGGRAHNPYGDPATRRENDAADTQADSLNYARQKQYEAAIAATQIARGELRNLMLEPLTEAQAAERVGEIFAPLNAALFHLSGHPQFMVDEHGDIRVRAGYEEKVLTIKTADVAAEKEEVFS